MSRQIHAIALFSGGLDSMIACRLVADLGIKVTAVYYDIGFGVDEAKKAWLEKTAKMSHSELLIVDITEQYVNEILFNPKYGYGKAFNPCIDCHANMFAHAEKTRSDLGADFIISGEVLGERPFSQNRNALNSVANHSGAKDKILRPLSAKLLPPTQMEIDGIIDRQKLLDLHGRGRTRQLDLAKRYGFTDYESPAGGCLYTDPIFANRIKEQAKHRMPNPDEIKLFKVGRHFRLMHGAKLIVGRNESENEIIANGNWSEFDTIIVPDNLIGPNGLLEKSATEQEKEVACQIIVSYGKSNWDDEYFFSIGSGVYGVYKNDKEAYIDLMVL